ncbi:MAG TPA: hypothetical protein VFI02_13720, partial [Armatimonadota bacterium]|nr:hypothetical protein [Armatimonadota bacterium]
MRKLELSLLVVLLAQFSYAADDARLDKPVTLAVKGEALSDILPMIEKQTGVRLKVAHDIADQKATIFVDDKPLKEIMAGLKTVFGFTWSYSDFKGQRSYSLSMPIKLRRERDNWRKQAIDKAWPEFEAEVKRLAEMPVKSMEELDDLSKQTERVNGEPPPSFKIMEYQPDRHKRAGARLYQTLSPALRKSLRDGMTVCFDLDSTEPEWQIPAKLDAELRGLLVIFIAMEISSSGYRPNPRMEFDSANFELRLVPSPDTFSVEFYEGLGKCSQRRFGRPLRLYEKPFSEFAPLPEVSLPRQDDSALDRTVTYTAKELSDEAALPYPPEPGQEGTYITRSDLLALLHKKLGLQIISDHYSHWSPWQSAEKITIRSLLKSFELFPGASAKDLDLASKDPNSIRVQYLRDRYPSADWGWDGGFLYMRAANPLRLDAREIPNRLLRRWLAASQEGRLGMAEMGEIHNLTPDQLSMLRANLDYLGISLWRAQIRGITSAYRLYGRLSPSQRDLMLGDGLGTQSFNKEQEWALLTLALKLRNSHPQGCRVGVYDAEGIRVDKPDTVPGYPERIRMTLGDPTEFYAVGDRQVGDSLKRVQGPRERAMLRKV